MNKKRVAIVGYGNIGKFVLEALTSSPDFEIAGIVRRDINNIPDELKAYKLVNDIKDLQAVDVPIPCIPIRKI